MSIHPSHNAIITTLSHDGRGIAHINGKTTFIANALPTEEVTFVYTKHHQKYDEAQAIAIANPSSERVEPRCAHFHRCGGCALQHMHTDLQLQLKEKMLIEQLKHFGGIQPKIILPPLTANPWSYRRKARLSVKYVAKKQTVLVGFHEKNGRYVADIKRCEILHPSIGHLIETLKILINDLSIYQAIPQIEMAVDDDHSALIFRHLKPFIESDKEKLIAFGKKHNLTIYLQPNDPQNIHLLWPENVPIEMAYRLPTDNLELFFQPMQFTQINAVINQKMIAQAIDLLAPQAYENILDLFCGIGNFTLPIARRCATVTGIEGMATLITQAKTNAIHNNISNAVFYQANLAVDCSAMAWAKNTYDSILLDPPRIGALEIIPLIIKLNAKRIVYVSCNPATLARDIGLLTQHGYRLEKCGMIDMFPHTYHVEAMALLVHIAKNPSF